MYYPKFIKPNETIGISAPSKGVGLKLDEYKRSIKRLSKIFKIKETSSVRNSDYRSALASIRAQELESLFTDDEVSMIFCASGGDFLYEILPYIDWNLISWHPKWYVGYSDPTSILYILTTKYDIASIYGMNGSSFDIDHEYVDRCLEIMQGHLKTQKSYEMYQSQKNFQEDKLIFDQKVTWIHEHKIHTFGRCIGGCLEVIKNLIGTQYDATASFIEKYKEDGFIWYFDNYGMSAEDTYLTLLQMKYANYFKYAKAVLFGRTCFESSHTGMSYQDALKLALEDIPYVLNCDIGHTSPRMMMINGAIMKLQVEDGKGKIDFECR